MMSRIATCVGLTLLGVPALAQDSPQSALQAFMAGFRATDPAAMERLFRPGSAFYGSTEPDLFVGPGDARGYFTRAWPPGSRRNLTCENMNMQEVAPSVAVISGICQLESTRPDGTQSSGGMRMTAVAVRDAEGWRIAAMHNSSVPPARR